MFVSRGGEKLDHALQQFSIPVDGLIAADLGCSTGGFTDCLLQHGAQKVYSIDTGYGVLDWKLRNDERVVVMERQNALYVELPEAVDVVVIDAGWTKQDKILSKALSLLKPGGQIVTLVKPHYEAYKEELDRGKVKIEYLNVICERVMTYITTLPVIAAPMIESPIAGGKGGNIEYLLWLRT